MKTNNTLAAYQIVYNNNSSLKLNTNKLYYWNIPKVLRDNPIQKGDIVQVSTRRGNKSVLVMDVFREEFEETNKRYKKVIKVTKKSWNGTIIATEKD